MEPACGVTTPATRLSNVDLPLPLAPRTNTRSSGRDEQPLDVDHGRPASRPGETQARELDDSRVRMSATLWEHRP